MLFNLLSENNPNGGGGYTWVVLIILVAVLVVMMITSNRANKKRAKEAQERLNNMKIGDRVKTIGGICGVVVEIDESENTFVLETGKASNPSYVKFDKVAVYETYPAESVETEEVEEETTEVFTEATDENTVLSSENDEEVVEEVKEEAKGE